MALLGSVHFGSVNVFRWRLILSTLCWYREVALLSDESCKVFRWMLSTSDLTSLSGRNGHLTPRVGVLGGYGSD